jgi:glycerol-1-phosphate dehydrogenase [NAD(P)+]
MMRDFIAKLIKGECQDADNGGFLHVPTRSVVIEKTLHDMEAQLVSDLGMGNTLAIVSDRHTFPALGNRIEKSLASIADILPVHLGEKPHPDIETVDLIRQQAALADGLVAVGSGTINDLCKYASACDHKPYVVFGTAPSMNGYTSVNASITVNGMKKTLPARGALGVFLDLDVFAHAPLRMIRSGLGDSVCRPTAQADWLLAHLLLGRPYREAPFTMLAEYESDLIASAVGLIHGDLAVMELLARTLVVSGFGMTICGGSEPASQGEHLISHVIEMLGSKAWPETFHGEQIGVATVTMAGIQEKILSGNPPYVKPNSVKKKEVLAFFGAELGESCWSELLKKMPDAKAVDAFNSKIESCWKNIQGKILPKMSTAGKIEQILGRIGAPITCQDIHVPPAFYSKAVVHAREMRDRYTFLDLAGDSGWLTSVNAFEN